MNWVNDWMHWVLGLSEFVLAYCATWVWFKPKKPTPMPQAHTPMPPWMAKTNGYLTSRRNGLPGSATDEEIRSRILAYPRSPVISTDREITVEQAEHLRWLHSAVAAGVMTPNEAREWA